MGGVAGSGAALATGSGAARSVDDGDGVSDGDAVGVGTARTGAGRRGSGSIGFAGVGRGAGRVRAVWRGVSVGWGWGLGATRMKVGAGRGAGNAMEEGAELGVARGVGFNGGREKLSTLGTVLGVALLDCAPFDGPATAGPDTAIAAAPLASITAMRTGRRHSFIPVTFQLCPSIPAPSAPGPML